MVYISQKRGRDAEFIPFYFVCPEKEGKKNSRDKLTDGL